MTMFLLSPTFAFYFCIRMGSLYGLLYKLRADLASLLAYYNNKIRIHLFFRVDIFLLHCDFAMMLFDHRFVVNYDNQSQSQVQSSFC